MRIWIGDMLPASRQNKKCEENKKLERGMWIKDITQSHILLFINYRIEIFLTTQTNNQASVEEQ